MPPLASCLAMLATAAWVLGLLAWFRLGTHERGSLTLATKVTLLRGGLIALLAGFLFAPPQRGFIGWLPGALYVTAALCDLLDGYLARTRHQESEVGARLDVALDALGLLVAPAVAIALGRLPVWYLLLGAAYYLFHGALWLRARAGRPTYPERLRPSRHARMFAGYQMGLVATVLFPVVRPPATTIAASLFMVPTLALFARDWLIATDALRPRAAAAGAALVSLFENAAALLLARVALAAGLGLLIGEHRLPRALVVVALALIGGVWVRVAAFAAALPFALTALDGPLDVAVYVLAVVLMLAGGGRFVVASPEARWLLTRAGEPRDASRS